MLLIHKMGDLNHVYILIQVLSHALAHQLQPNGRYNCCAQLMAHLRYYGPYTYSYACDVSSSLPTWWIGHNLSVCNGYSCNVVIAQDPLNPGSRCCGLNYIQKVRLRGFKSYIRDVSSNSPEAHHRKFQFLHYSTPPPGVVMGKSLARVPTCTKLYCKSLLKCGMRPQYRSRRPRVWSPALTVAHCVPLTFCTGMQIH